jgi:hypothetical protein
VQGVPLIVFCGNEEPIVEELLDDPIVRLMMARDRLQAEHVWACVTAAREKLKAREASGRGDDQAPVMP